MALVAFAFSLLIAALGAVAIVEPTVLLAIARPLLTPAGLYAAAALRLVLGTALFVSAPTSRAPKTLRVLGVIIIVGGLATPLIGVERARAIVEWWAAQGSGFMRVWAGVALAFGLFLAYAIAPQTPRSDRV
jgi:hypothetical protein